MKCRLRESRLIAINEGERSLTAADASAVIRSMAMKPSIRLATECLPTRMQVQGRACVPPGSISQTTQYKRVSNEAARAATLRVSRPEQWLPAG